MLSFFEERIPEALVLLRYTKDNEPIDDYEEMVEHFSEIVWEYRSLAEEEGAEEGRSASSKNKSGRARTHRKSASRTPRSCGFEYVAPEST
mgnify:CR=1 FL=1